MALGLAIVCAVYDPYCLISEIQTMEIDRREEQGLITLVSNFLYVTIAYKISDFSYYSWRRTVGIFIR